MFVFYYLLCYNTLALYCKAEIVVSAYMCKKDDFYLGGTLV